MNHASVYFMASYFIIGSTIALTLYLRCRPLGTIDWSSSLIILMSFLFPFIAMCLICFVFLDMLKQKDNLFADKQTKWVVNNQGQLGIHAFHKFVWFYQGIGGCSIVYDDDAVIGGIPVMWRPVDDDDEFSKYTHPALYPDAAECYERGSGWRPLSDTPDPNLR